MTDVFHLRLPPADTLELIRRSVDPPVRGFTASGFAGSKAFIGEVQDNSFWIVRRPRFRNGFRRVLRGKVVHTVNGSDVICQFRMSAATLTAVGAWYCLVTISDWHKACGRGLLEVQHGSAEEETGVVATDLAGTG